MTRKVNGIIRRALKNGFDLSTIKNFSPKIFHDKLYTYLVDKKYFCFSEDNIIVVSDLHLKITPLKPEGVFDLLMDVFKFIADNPDLKPEEDISTEENSPEEIPSEEFDWI
jgi:hypothetical protein